ncbi:MAG: type II secretion system F family protein [Nanoarchaeota archaeon]|nr:type II secretion system F family protein [Nanoarchaeota archaeon]
MYEDLKRNIEQEKRIIADIKSILVGMRASPYTRPFYMRSLMPLLEQLKILNKTVPELLKENSPLQKVAQKISNEKSEINSELKSKEVVKMTYVSPSTKEQRYVTLNKKDKSNFLKKLKLSEDIFSELNKQKIKESKTKEIRPSIFIKLSNRFFRDLSEKYSPSFSGVSQDLKKGNVPFLVSSYLSMAFMSMVISFFAGIFLLIFLVVVDLSNWIYFWLPFGLTGLTAAGFYFYPASEASSVQKKINHELPFATIHMAAISGSDIEPTKIFKIISKSKEYPNIGKEIKKVIIQTDLYGYDLVTSLKNVASRTSNKKLGELFSGLATNIGTGGSLKAYLEEKAETFLLDYRLERQKYTELAGTFMDIYISVLITAPLVLMMMFIIMNVAGLGFEGLTIDVLMFISVGAIILVNIIFVVILNIKQPKV